MTLHDEVYSRYQEVHESHVQAVDRGQWMRRAAALNIIPHIRSGGEVLEIGCGQGDLLDALRDYGSFAIWGSDLCKENRQMCKAKGHTVTGWNYFTQPGPGAFDAIVMMGVVEHIRKDDLLTVLRNLWTRLNPGGALIVTTQNMDALIGVHYRYLDITHELGFTRESLAQVGRLVFDDVRVLPWREPPVEGLNWRGVIVERWLRRVWKAVWRFHVRMVHGPVVDSWYDEVGLVGVFRRA